MLKDRSLRTSITTQSHYWFFNTYFAHYVKHETADFQREMFQLTEDESLRLAVVVAFRGSGKSTIMTMSFPIWSILGKQQKKFVVLIGQTQQQAKLHLTNLRRELEANDLLRADLGPFQEQEEEWSSGSLVLPRYDARITALSTEQGIRGLRHGAIRPDLIICDDVEDLTSVRTREGREAKHQWFTGDVVPCGDLGTRTVVVGNLLHEDSLIMRLKQDIKDKKLDGAFRAYPLVTEDGRILWPGKYPDMERVEKLKQSIGNEISWQREYMLRIVSDAGRVIHPEWIRYYDTLDDRNKDDVVMSVDLAISEKETADYTAMLAARVRVDRDLDRMRIQILPNPVNARLDFPTARERINEMVDCMGGRGSVLVIVEDVAYQKAMIQELQMQGHWVEGIRPHGDKRARIALTSNAIKQGAVLFPREGCEELVAQLTGYGVERHDDLADAFSMLVLHAIAWGTKQPSVHALGGDPDIDDERWWKPLSSYWG